MDKQKNIYSIIGKRIREERKKQGLTQEQVADKANMDYKFLSTIELNVNKPSLDTFVRIAKALNVSCDSLLTNNNEDAEQIKNLTNQFHYLIADLSKNQQNKIIDLLKTAKDLLK